MRLLARNPTLESAIPWVKRGGFAILDQALFSGANFLVNILLARWLSPREYGAFAVALSIFYLLAGFHTAILTEPMMVFGAGKYRKQFRKYLDILLYGHWGISFLISLGLWIVAWIIYRWGSSIMAQALTGLAIASPFLLFLWFARRACYAQFQPVWAMVGSGFNLIIILIGLFLLWQQQKLSLFNGFLILGIGAVFASLILIKMLKPYMLRNAENLVSSVVFYDHFSYGKWSLGAIIASGFSLNIFIILMPIFLNLEGVATYRALYNLIAPMQNLLTAISPLILTYLSNKYAKSSPSSLQIIVTRSAIGLGILSMVYFVILVIFGRDAILIIYSGKYSKVYHLLFLMGLYPFLTSQSIIWGNALRAASLINRVMAAYFMSSILLIIFAIPLMVFFDVFGAVLDLLIYGVSLCVILALEWKQKCNVR